MPLPEKNDGETKEDFMERCMGNDTMNKEFPDSDQRYKVCESQYDKGSSGSGSALASVMMRLSGDNMWAIELSALQKLTSAVRSLTLRGYDEYERWHDRKMIPVTIGKNGIAIVKAHGVVMRKPESFSWFFRSSFLDPDVLRETIKSLVEDHSVKGIVIDIDSPGGEIPGMLACAETIYNLRDIKPIHAWTPYTMASAAYAIGAACGKVKSVPDSRVGSIGIIYTHYDFSPSNQGYMNVTEFVSGKWKALGSEDRPMTDEEKLKIQEYVNEAATMLFGMVSKYRGISDSEIRRQEADVFGGNKAIENGLVDSLAGTIEDVIREMAAEVGENITKGEEVMAIDMKELQKKFPGVNKATLKAIVNMTLQAQDDDGEETMPGTESECKEKGYYWYDNSCHKDPQAGGEDGGDANVSGKPVEAQEEKPSYTTQEECESAGHTWRDGKCYEKMEETTTTTVYITEAEKRIRKLEATIHNMNIEAANSVWEKLFSKHPMLSDSMKEDMKNLVCPKKHIANGVLNKVTFETSAMAKLDEWTSTSVSGYGTEQVDFSAGSQEKSPEYYKNRIKKLKEANGR